MEQHHEPKPEPVRSAVEKVLENPHLLHCIAQALSPRGRLLLSTVNRASRAAVDTPAFWASIEWTVAGGSGNDTRVWSYEAAAKHGNRLGAVLRQYGRYCAQLHLAHCPWLQVTGLEDLGRCGSLVHLDMSGCSNYAVDLLGSLVRHCPRLKSLVARGCTRICEPAIIQELFDTPESHRLNLEHLDMQGVMFLQDAAAPGSDLGHCVERLAGGRLASLRLGWLGEAAPAPHTQQQLYVGDLRPVLQAVRRCGDTLRLLDLAGCWSPHGDLALPPCLAALSALRCLCLSNWQGGPAVGEALRRCPTTQLTHLNLRAVVALTDADLAPLLWRNPRLRSINLGCCAALTDDTLHTLAAACPGLTALDVCYASGMTGAGVRDAATALPRLEDYGFSGFAGLLDADVAEVVGRLPGLRMLGIGGIPRLTDACLRSVAASAASTQLDTLYAADLPNITAAGLLALLAACPRLRRLAVARCAQLSAADQARLGESHPYCFDGDMLPPEVAAAENSFITTGSVGRAA